MVQFGLSGVAKVDLTRFWPAWQAIAQERERVDYYTAARDFWTSYDTKLTMARDNVTGLRRDMELHTRWSSLDRLGRPSPEAASTAFYGRVDAGINSVQTWLNGGTATVGERFKELALRLPGDIQQVDLHRETLLKQDKVLETRASRGPIAALTTAKIVEGDGEVDVPVLSADRVRQAIEDTVRRHDELTALFRQITDDLNRLPHDVTWAGPTTLAAETPPGGTPGAGGPGTGPGGPADGPASPGGPGTGPGGPNGPGGPGGPDAGPGGPGGPGVEPGGPGASPGGPGAGPGGQDPAAADAEVPGGPDTGPDAAAAQESMPAPGTDVPGADMPGGQAVDPSTGDPALAGMPSATLTPPTPTMPLPSNGPNIPAGVAGPAGMPTGSLGPGGIPTGSPGPGRMPTGAPGPTSMPGPGGIPTGTPGPGASPAVSPVPPTSSPTPHGSTTGAGFYPPMMPPMAPGGRTGGAAIRPGEADVAGGSVRRVDSWRAGLRPQLLGRAGEHDDEPCQVPAPQPFSGGEVLDEELWQVPDAAPPEPPRRGRSWGPG